MNLTPGEAFLQTAIKRLKYYKSLGDKTFSQLDPNDFHFTPDAESNSIAVIIQHIWGNMMSRWTDVLNSDGEKPWRERDLEFVERKLPSAELLNLWEEGWQCFLGALESFKEEDLVKTITIREESLSLIDAINRQLAHYPYHIGQIVFIGKMIKQAKWRSLSIPKGQSQQYNQSPEIKDPAKKFEK
ncbi:MAG: DUF1572 domain-containing protein [Chitinophagaceae bacterium]|uniref:DUF1572 family protein n=1 Tax=unclassified Paraflavitalea TaxID=2798305 RepID=UPI003D3402E6|nr:DUF1572 domain-containing protein [Chitinophagaceae bacterium]